MARIDVKVALFLSVMAGIMAVVAGTTVLAGRAFVSPAEDPATAPQAVSETTADDA